MTAARHRHARTSHPTRVRLAPSRPARPHLMARGRLALAGLVRPRLELTGLVRPRLELADLVRPRLALAVIAVAVAGCAGGAPTPEVPARAPEPAPAEAPAIVDRPISFSEERIEMTREYIRGHYGFDPDEIAFTPRMIVLHWTAIEDLEATFRTFDPETLGGRPDLSGAGAVNVSSQFVVAKDGTIYRLMPENWMARHVIGLNWGAIGVENVGSGTRESSTLTDDQAAANIALVRYLVRKYPTIEYLIGHHEYRAFEGHPLWLERDPDYRTDKIDPGDAFMAAVRAGVEDLGLLGPP